jgi:hypothetical protein
VVWFLGDEKNISQKVVLGEETVEMVEIYFSMQMKTSIP